MPGLSHSRSIHAIGNSSRQCRQGIVTMSLRRLGTSSAAVMFLIGVAYAVVLAAGFAIHGLTEPIEDPVLPIMEVLTLMSAPPPVVVVVILPFAQLLVEEVNIVLGLRVTNVQPQTPVIIELDRTPNFLETVQVTATKSAPSIGDVAALTTTVDRETIERRGDSQRPLA
jgi:hypothetical protein